MLSRLFKSLFVLCFCLASTARAQMGNETNELEQQLKGYWSLVTLVADDSVDEYPLRDSLFNFYEACSFRLDTVSAFKGCLSKGIYNSFGLSPFVYIEDPITEKITLMASSCGPWIVIRNKITDHSFAVCHISNSGDFPMTMTVKTDSLVFEGKLGPLRVQEKKYIEVYKRVTLPEYIKKQIRKTP